MLHATLKCLQKTICDKYCIEVCNNFSYLYNNFAIGNMKTKKLLNSKLF